MNQTYPYPTLKRDAEAMARGWRPSADHLVERMVVFTLLEQILATLPSAKLKVHNGDEWLDCGRDPVAAMEEIFSVDDSTVKVWSAQSLLPPDATDHDAAPAARAAVAPGTGHTTRGTGDTTREPVAWAIQCRGQDRPVGFWTYEEKDGAEFCLAACRTEGVVVPLYSAVVVEILKLRVAELEQAIRRLADQDATLSVCDGNVTVEMEATLTDAEVDLLEWAKVAATSFDSFWIRLICGNGVDIISDYSVNPVLEQIIDRTERMVGLKPRFQ